MTAKAATQGTSSVETLHVRSLEAVPLAVGGAGLELKENARVSTLLVP